MRQCKWIRLMMTLTAVTVLLVAPLAVSAGQPVKLTLWSGYPEM